MSAKFERIEDPVLISLLKEHISCPQSSSAMFDRVFNSSSYPPNLYKVMIPRPNGGRDITWIKHNGRIEAEWTN